MPLPSKLEAQDFFGQLRRFSARLIAKTLPGVPAVSSHASAYRAGRPIGAILHYTAAVTWQSPVRWFNSFGRVSAHVVVCDRREPVAAGLDADLPLIRALPVTTIQCVPPDRAARHATWANGLCYGIENCNAGLVRRDGPSAPWRHWPKAHGSDVEWTSLAPTIAGKSYVATSSTEGYEPYTREQLAANVVLLRYVSALFGEPLAPHLMLPHSAVQTSKRDTGPLFPIHEIRRLACIDVGVDPMAALAHYDPASARTSTDDLIAQPALDDDDRTDEDLAALEATVATLTHVGSGASTTHPFAPSSRAQLDRLGFFVPTPSDPKQLDAWLQRALWIFQTGAKLKATNEPDAPTRAALAARLVALGFDA